MRAFWDGHEVLIVFDPQRESLKAPNGKKYLPCDGRCGKLRPVSMQTISTTCAECVKKMTFALINGGQKAVDGIKDRTVFMDRDISR